MVVIVVRSRSCRDEFPEPGHGGPPELTTRTCGKQTDKTHSTSVYRTSFTLYTINRVVGIAYMTVLVVNVIIM